MCSHRQGRPGAETREIAPGLVADIDADGAVVGIDIDGASRKLDLTTLETIALPVKTTAPPDPRSGEGRPGSICSSPTRSQDAWIYFPWDMSLAFQPPIAKDGA